MIDEIYYDTFKNSYTLERVENSPQERYKRIRRGVNDLYRECWVINSDIYDEDDLFLKIVFSEEEYNDKDQHDITIKHVCDTNHCKPIRLRYVDIPPYKFDEIVKQLEEERDMREPTFSNDIDKCESEETEILTSFCDKHCFPRIIKDQKCSENFLGRYTGYCPRCGAFLVLNSRQFPDYRNYCEHCGQRLWWEKPDENKPESV